MDVIEFLERMGKDAELRYASEAVLERALTDAQMTFPVRAALMSKDRGEIEAVLAANTNVCCAIYAPVPEEDESHKSREQQAAVDNVCCLIYAPPDGQEDKSAEPKWRDAA